MTQPTLQECLKRINAVIQAQDNPKIVGAFNTDMLRAIRAQLEAGKQCAEALEYVKPYVEHFAITGRPRKTMYEALSRATATGLIEGKS